MRHWNEKQPGGQGLAVDFDIYFNSLNDASKEVKFPGPYTIQLTCLSVALPKGDVHHMIRQRTYPMPCIQGHVL